MTNYADVYKNWQNDPEAFWMDAASAIDWDTAPSGALDATNAPFYNWFSDARVNTCWNAVDRHVAGDQRVEALQQPADDAVVG